MSILPSASVQLAVFFLIGSAMLSSQSMAQAPEPIALFDGKTLGGWEGNPDWFRIEDGAIIAGRLDARIPRNEFLCTEAEYADFTLRLQFKLLGKGVNAGVQIRTRRIPGDHEVIGYQADLGDGWWGSLYDESRRNRVLAAADEAVIERVLKREAWNHYTIHAEGRRVRLAINGEQTVDYTEPDESLEQIGKICVQIHSGPPSEAWYKDITLEQHTNETAPDSVYTLVDEAPILIGGMPLLWSQFQYPASAQEAGITGRIYVQLVVDTDGTVRDARVVRGLEPGCDEEALRMVNQAQFTPGQHQGRPVKVLQTLQIRCEPNAIANVGPPRVIAIRTRPSYPVAEEPTQFSALLIGKKPIRYRWYFDDGTIDTTAGPVYTFQSPGSHGVVLEASNSMGSIRDTLDLNVGVGAVPFDVVDEMPELIGGLRGMQRKIYYPEEARKARIQGVVIIQFIVDENGDVRDAYAVQGIGGGCDEEALRVVREARFRPGKQEGKPVKVKLSLPITFKLK